MWQLVTVVATPVLISVRSVVPVPPGWWADVLNSAAETGAVHISLPFVTVFFNTCLSGFGASFLRVWTTMHCTRAAWGWGSVVSVCRFLGCASDPQN